jgi:hydrogenase maturation protease
VPEQIDSARGGRTVVIGLGNELLSDDGLGIRAVRALRERLAPGDFDFKELSVGGLELLDYITGYGRCIIVDAVATGNYPPGTLMRFLEPADGDPVALASSHQIDLSQVLTLGRIMGGAIPHTVLVYGIEAQDVTTFHDACTEDVQRALPVLVEIICRDIDGRGSLPPPGTWQVLEAEADRTTTE